jgi:DNA-binding NarL/FixJ family response regulator
MSISVFVGDDHAVIREGLTQLLNSHADFNVVGTACDGRDTVKQALKLRPDVIIMDIAMPGMNGIEATREICDASPAAHVVILSMHSAPEYVFHALEAGAQGYVHKESAFDEIANAVRAVNTGRRYVSGKIADSVAGQVVAGFGANPLSMLSKREREVLQLVTESHSSIEIGEILHISSKTVDSYRSRLMHKLQIGDVPGLVKFAIQHGLTSIE